MEADKLPTEDDASTLSNFLLDPWSCRLEIQEDWFIIVVESQEICAAVYMN